VFSEFLCAKKQAKNIGVIVNKFFSGISRSTSMKISAFRIPLLYRNIRIVGDSLRIDAANGERYH
jgi:hypothetical protein